ncbi:hypothetical protein HPB49_002534 [Dermacentor silvarum]|uniref:Uncharacterized protein n=1 Tax=Dermacentor silvarum TaxID=543639 RepID=A0ACB8D255_DERSI|nr:hypothetical protein HPB49_002534 [Dermacentor silvarum]
MVNVATPAPQDDAAAAVHEGSCMYQTAPASWIGPSQTHGLLFEAFKSVSMTAWEERSVLEVQAMLAFAASVMAETTDKQVIVDIMAPMVIHISELKQMHPAYYAIPVIVGASSNFIMPASVPLAILHDLSRVSFWKLFLLGMFAKIVVMSMVIVAVNVVERAGFLGGQAPAQ